MLRPDPKLSHWVGREGDLWQSFSPCWIKLKRVLMLPTAAPLYILQWAPQVSCPVPRVAKVHIFAHIVGGALTLLER